MLRTYARCERAKDFDLSKIEVSAKIRKLLEGVDPEKIIGTVRARRFPNLKNEDKVGKRQLVQLDLAKQAKKTGVKIASIDEAWEELTKACDDAGFLRDPKDFRSTNLELMLSLIDERNKDINNTLNNDAVLGFRRSTFYANEDCYEYFNAADAQRRLGNIIKDIMPAQALIGFSKYIEHCGNAEDLKSEEKRYFEYFDSSLKSDFRQARSKFEIYVFNNTTDFKWTLRDLHCPVIITRLQ